MSQEPERGWLPAATGVLEISAGASALLGSGPLFFLAIGAGSLPLVVDSSDVPPLPFALASGHFLSLALLLVVAGIVSVIGGVHAIRRSSRLWPLVGGVAAIVSFFPLGITATVLAVLMDRNTGAPAALPSRTVPPAPDV